MPRSNKKSSTSSGSNQCTICLSNLEPKKRSVISTCLHEFCFSCIKKWSKENAVCPLCKQNFTEVLHNIRSDADYDTYEVTKPTSTNNRRCNRHDQDETSSPLPLASLRIYLQTNVSSFISSSRVPDASDDSDDLLSDLPAVSSRRQHDTPDATRPARTARRLFNRREHGKTLINSNGPPINIATSSYSTSNNSTYSYSTSNRRTSSFSTSNNLTSNNPASNKRTSNNSTYDFARSVYIHNKVWPTNSYVDISSFAMKPFSIKSGNNIINFTNDRVNTIFNNKNNNNSNNLNNNGNGINIQLPTQTPAPTASASFLNNSIINGQITPNSGNSASWTTSSSNDYSSHANKKRSYSSSADEVDEGGRKNKKMKTENVTQNSRTSCKKHRTEPKNSSNKKIDFL